jgi:hypothetical protein
VTSATVLTFVGFSRAHAQVTGDAQFRKALDLAIARGGLTSSGSGERVTPTDDPIPVDLGGPALGSAAGGGNIDAATKALAASKVPALAADKRGDLSLEILVDQTRLDDHEVAEKIVRALDKLGIAATITAVGAGELAAKVDKGEGDLYIGQLASPGVAPDLLWSAAFAAGGDGWAAKHLAAGDFDPNAASVAFHDHLPIVPLLHRGVRIYHRSDVRGVGFDASSRIDFADLFLFGDPVKSKRKHG